MARTPWATIKLCLPSWLVESAPYKQAFVFFLVMLFPSLFLSPFLLSPLLTLLLLSSATVAGALSAWMTMKVTRTVLAHSSPLPPTPSSCFKSLVHIMSLKIFSSVIIANTFHWIWLWFVKILTSSDSKNNDRGNDGELPFDTIGKYVDEVSSGSQEVYEEALNEIKSNSEVMGSDVLGEEVEVSNIVTLRNVPSSDKELLGEIKSASEEGKEKLRMLEFGRGGIGSVYFRGATYGAKSFRPKKDENTIPVGVRVHAAASDVKSSHAKDGSESEILQRGNISESASSHVGRGHQKVENVKVFDSESEEKLEIAQKDDHLVFDGQSGLRMLPSEIMNRKSVGPNNESDKTKVIRGCASHSWCQKGFNFEEELALLGEDIHKLCLGKWYPSLSSDETFPTELKVLLDICVRHATYLGSRCDIPNLAVKLGSLFLCHLREFRKARRKKRAAETVTNTNREDELRKFEQSISAENFAVEDTASRKSDSSIQSAGAGLLQSKDLGSLRVQEEYGSLLPEKSTVIMEPTSDNISAVSQPLTPHLMTPSPKSSIHSVSNKQKILAESHLGEEAYYRFRFGQTRVNKDAPRNYLLNISLYIVKNFVNRVGKLPSDPLEHYFRDCGANLADSPPGKVLVSLVARKIILPLVETVSDPNWLNLRITNLLVDHARAKIHLDSDENKDNPLCISAGVRQVVSASKDRRNAEVEDVCGVPVKSEGTDDLVEVSKESGTREERRKSLSLPLETSGSSMVNPIDGRISSVLGGIISATAAPLLPDNAKVSYKPIKRMWSSPSIEEAKELDGEPEYKKKMRPFGRNIVDGLPVVNDGALTTSAQDVLCTTGTEEFSGTHSLSSSKDSHGTSRRKARLSLTSRNPRKKRFLGLPFGPLESPGSSTHGILFRSKSSHDVQNGKEGVWHIEEGSELHEDAYLSDDPASPMTQEKEMWERFDRKPNRSRSFHGIKSYNRQKEGDELDNEQSCAKETSRQIPEKDSIGGNRAILRVSSEGSMRERCSKGLEVGGAELSEGLGTRWMKYALGKWDNQWASEGDSDEINRMGSLHSSLEKGEKGSAVGSGTSLSEGYVSPDVFRLENKFWSNDDSIGKTMADKKSVREGRLGSDSDERKEMAIYHSSPIPSAAIGDDSNKEIPKDISPVYEEVEDLPSTIAKLKALLKERNEKMGETMPPPSGEEMKQESEVVPVLESSLDQESTQIPKPPSSPLEERPFLWPSDGGIFLNVRIPCTEICKGTSTSQTSSTSPHVLYCIEYDAAYPEEGADAAVTSLENEAEHSAAEQSGDKDHKDALATSENAETVPPSPGTMVHHIVVKRKFQEFLDLHAQLEADPLWRQALKGLKGPSRWLSLPFGKTSASTVAGRRTLLQAYLRGVCTSMPQLASSSKALRTFMAYQGVYKPVVSGGTLPSSVERVLPLAVEGGEGPVPRIDKLFARTVSGMFNTLKTALPGFDSPETTQISSVTQTSTSSSPNPPSHTSLHDSSSAPATLSELKGTSGYPGTIRGTMIQLPAFLQFGNSNASRYPDLVDWDMDYGERDSEGNVTAPGTLEGLPAKNYSLEEDIQTFLNGLVDSIDTRTDSAEFAYEALNPFALYEDGKEYEEQGLRSCLQKVLARQYTVDSADEDCEEEELDAFLPLTKVTIDILCEALRGTGSWASQGTVVHASKVLIGSFIERKLQDFLKAITTKEMWCQYIHILRVALFHHAPSSCQSEVSSKETGSSFISGQQLAVAIYTAFPSLFRQIVGNRQLLEAAKFIADSLQNKVILKELVLQVLHVCIVHLVPAQSVSMELN